MALQIGRIKASRRKILPSLNVDRYQAVTGKDNKTYYRTKRTLKSSRKTILITEGGKTRFALENRELARRTIRNRLGSGIPKSQWDSWINEPRIETGRSLKKGILGMAQKAGIMDEELYRKLEAMDEDVLKMMYNKGDKLIFDVAFSYDSEGGIPENKEEDLWYAVETYEQMTGIIL